MRKKAYTVYLDEMFLPCIIQVEIIGTIWSMGNDVLIGMPMIEINLPPLSATDLCETLEEGFVLSVKKYQNWN